MPRNQLHLICALRSFNARLSKFCMRTAMRKNDLETAVVSIVNMRKENCITKEQFDMEYGITGNSDKNKKREKDIEYKTLGDDLEAFISRIKNGEITKSSIPLNGETKTFSLHCLLDKDERRKVDTKDEGFLYTFCHRRWADVLYIEFMETEHPNLKYSKSAGFRKTFIFDANVEITHES